MGLGQGGGVRQGGWEQRSEACVKIQKKKKLGGGSVGGVRGGGVGLGVRVDVNGELQFCENSKKKKLRGGRGGVGVGGGSDQGGWEQRSEACVKIQKKKIGGGGGGGVRVGGSGWM